MNTVDAGLQPLLVTYDNKPNDNTHRFVRTLKANAWDHILLGEGDVWEGWSTRMKAYRHCLASLPDEKVVVLSDARDVVCLRGSKAFMKGFASYKKDITISCDLTNLSEIICFKEILFFNNS